MKIEVEVIEQATGNLQFTTIKSLSFAPEVDLKGDSISIDEFSADIITDKSVGIARWCWLYDDRNVLFGKFWVTSADHVESDILRLHAKSVIYLLEGVKMPAVMYAAMSFETILQSIFEHIGWSPGDIINQPYSIDQSFANATITGFCPEQTARERLLWVCFSLGAYVRTCFSNRAEILPVSSTQTFIPLERTFWKPTVTFKDYVTALTIKYYDFTFTQNEPETTDVWVKDANDNVYIVTEYAMTLANDFVPYGVPDNEVVIEGVYLLNGNNVSSVLTNLMSWYFNRNEIDADVINNGEYKPGQNIIICAEEGSLYNGFIESCDFSFGLQARSKIHVSAVNNIATGVLIITYTCDGAILGEASFTLPAYYTYSIENPYFDLTVQDHRIIYRPHNATTTGETYIGENNVEEPCSPALDLYEGILDVISVDAVDVDENNTADID